jgi:hypothetical protein
MFKRLAFLLLFLVLISGCILDKNDSSGVNDELKGIWNTGDAINSLLHINNDSFTFLYYVNTYECYSQYSSNILYSNNSIITRNGHSNKIYEDSWKVIDSQLTLTDDRGSRTFSKSDLTINTIDLCSNSFNNKTTYLSIKFEKLPEVMSLNHEATASDEEISYTEFNISISLDLNSNRISDHGDIEFYLHHSKDNGDTPQLIRSDDFFGHSSLLEPSNDETWLTLTPLVVHNYTVENNTLVIQFSNSEHAAFSAITSSMNIKISAGYLDKTGRSQYDQFPDSGDFTPIGTDLSHMLDNTDDANSTFSESISVDIQEISIQFAE